MMQLRQLVKECVEGLGFSKHWVLQSQEELRMGLIRVKRLLGLSGYTVKEEVYNKDSLCVNFGSGNQYCAGWYCIDAEKGENVDLIADLRQRLPFRDASVSMCYSSHFLEHLYPEEVESHLREVHRILLVGGVYRVVVPDVLRFAKKYLEGDDEFFKVAFPWADRPMTALYSVANWEGRHRSIIDYNELCCLGRLSGFSNVLKSNHNESIRDELNIDIATEQRISESAYIELVK